MRVGGRGQASPLQCWWLLRRRGRCPHRPAVGAVRYRRREQAPALRGGQLLRNIVNPSGFAALTHLPLHKGGFGVRRISKSLVGAGFPRPRWVRCVSAGGCYPPLRPLMGCCVVGASIARPRATAGRPYNHLWGCGYICGRIISAPTHPKGVRWVGWCIAVVRAGREARPLRQPQNLRRGGACPRP